MILLLFITFNSQKIEVVYLIKFKWPISRNRFRKKTKQIKFIYLITK